MITIKNISKEEVELVPHLDRGVPGCRLADQTLATEILRPDDEITFMAYEPGISYTIRPVKAPEVPRKRGAHGGFAMQNGGG
jgi:hypothetical protein